MTSFYHSLSGGSLALSQKLGNWCYTLRRDEKPQISLAVISKRLRQSLTIGERLYMDKQSQLPEFDDIQAAVRGEQWAIDKVVAHYGDFINEQSAVEENSRTVPSSASWMRNSARGLSTGSSGKFPISRCRKVNCTVKRRGRVHSPRVFCV